MFETELINEIRERLSMFIGLYDSIRIVDPIKKELIKEEGGPAHSNYLEKGAIVTIFGNKIPFVGIACLLWLIKTRNLLLKSNAIKMGRIVYLPCQSNAKVAYTL